VGITTEGFSSQFREFNFKSQNLPKSPVPRIFSPESGVNPKRAGFLNRRREEKKIHTSLLLLDYFAGHGSSDATNKTPTHFGKTGPNASQFFLAATKHWLFWAKNSMKNADFQRRPRTLRFSQRIYTFR